MRKIIVLSFIAASALISTQAMAQGPRTNINLEPTCQGTGGGMDPRCIGDVTPGSDRALRRTRSGQRYDARVHRSHRSTRSVQSRKRYAINCSARANRNNPRCMR
jgi:hypothetical protein